MVAVEPASDALSFPDPASGTRISMENGGGGGPDGPLVIDSIECLACAGSETVA